MTTSTKELLEQSTVLAGALRKAHLNVPAQALENAAQRLRDLDKPDCVWTNGDSDEEFETSCGHAFTFIDGGISDNNCNFCQYCGGSVKSGGTPNECS